MSLALACAISAILLLITSQVQRRAGAKLPWLQVVVKGLTAIVVVLVVVYFYQRVTA